MKKVVLIGAGYANMTILRELLRLPVEITLIDRNPYHSLKTEFYALAAGTISDQAAHMPLPDHKNLNICVGEVIGVDFRTNKVHVREQADIGYDYLVIGVGCENEYHKITGASLYALSLQTIKKTRKTFEKIANLDPYQTVSILGGGLTGVELACALRENRPDLNIQIIERNETVLHTLDEKIVQHAEKWLSDHNIKVIRQFKMERIEEAAIFGSGGEVPSDAIVWAAGIGPTPFVQNLEAAKTKRGQLQIDSFYRLMEYNNVFAAGDCADFPLPPSAQLAQQQGKQIAKVIKALVANKEMPKLKKIVIKGNLGALGHSNGFGYVSGWVLTGSSAKWLKRFVLWLHKWRM